MKITIEVDEKCNEDQVIIRCQELNETVEKIQKSISEMTNVDKEIVLYKDKKEFYIPPDDILFFEAVDNVVWAHTVDDIFLTKYKLYELERLMPWYFSRISKSAIVNTNKIYSITKNITSSSKIEFRGTPKKIYASRSYYKMLMLKMNERIKK